MGDVCRAIMADGIDKPKEGTGYLGRIKVPSNARSVHKKKDLLYVVIYEDPDVNLNYMDVKHHFLW